MRGAALIVVLTALMAGCSGDDPAATAVEPAATPTAGGTVPAVGQTHQTPTAMEPGTTVQPPAPPAPTTGTSSTTTPPPPPSAGRSAPPQRVRAIRFDQVRLFPAASGDFAGRAAMTNLGRDELDAIVVYWIVRNAAGKVLDRGQLEWLSLAPGGTATIQLAGAEPYRDDWRKVKFDYALAGVGP